MDGKRRIRKSSTRGLLLVRAEVPEGEEGTWVTEIEETEINIMEPLLREIKKRDGYFPSGQFLYPTDPKPEILYSHLPGWNSLISRLPTPKTGMKRILEIHYVSGAVKSLYM